MNPRPLISIVVPAYNAGTVLAQALTSIQNQTYNHFEVHVVDDGSTDRTSHIAAQFAASDPRIQFCRQANAGSAVARNTALQKARGELIAFLDADDAWLPTKLESQLQLLQSDPDANFIFSNYYVWSGEQDLSIRYPTRKKFPEGDVERDLSRWNIYRTSTVLLKRETLDRVGPFDPELRNAQDWDMWIRIAETGFRARGVWEPQARYRIWPGNVTANKVRATGFGVLMYEKALARPQSPERLRRYQRLLKIAQANAELAKAQATLEHSPEAVPAAILRAWKLSPLQIKWLFRYFGLVWPAALGGNWTSAAVRRKLKGWRMGRRLEIGALASPGSVSGHSIPTGAGPGSKTLSEPL